MNKIPENSEARDDKNFQEYMAGGKPDPYKEAWLDDFKTALMELGFDEFSTEDIIDDKTLTLRYDLDPEEFADSLRFCVECDWVGTVDQLVQGFCPACGVEI